jgi:hypothetical protein
MKMFSACPRRYLHSVRAMEIYDADRVDPPLPRPWMIRDEGGWNPPLHPANEFAAREGGIRPPRPGE